MFDMNRPKALWKLYSVSASDAASIHQERNENTQVR